MKWLVVAVVCSTLFFVSTGEKVKRQLTYDETEEGNRGPPQSGGTESSPSKSPLLGRPDGHEDHHESHDQDPLGQLDGPDSHQTKDSEYEYPKSVGDIDDEEKDAEFESNYDLNEDQLNGENENDVGDEEPDVYSDSDLAEEDTPLVRCKRPMCRMLCQEGFQTDSLGCPICKCLEDPCEMMVCENGYTCHASECQTGKECVARTAQCAPDRSNPLGCPMMKCSACDNGYVVDERGCRTCTCLKRCTGPEPMCATDCEMLGGYKYNDEGCMTCDCNVAAIPAAVSDEKMPCAVPSCDTDCFGKYKYDDEGCMTCTCIDSDSFFASLCIGEHGIYAVALGGVLAAIVLLATVFIIIKMVRHRNVRAYNRHRLLDSQTSTNSQKSLLRDDGCMSVSMSDDKPSAEKHAYA